MCRHVSEVTLRQGLRLELEYQDGCRQSPDVVLFVVGDLPATL